MTPSPDVRVCLECGWSEFIIPRSWLAAGWLRSMHPKTVTIRTEFKGADIRAAAS